MDQVYSTDEESISPVTRPTTIRDHVYFLLRDRLGTGRFALNERIIEKDLVEQLGVSRTPVRDALARLASEGFLVSTKHGYRVPTITREDIEYMTEMRAVVEPLAAQQAAENGTSVGFAEMRRAIEEEKTADQNDDANRFEKAHLDFRNAWLSRVKNPLLLETVGKSLITLQLIRHLALKKREIRAHILESHLCLLNNIETRSAQQAYDTQKTRVFEFHELLTKYVVDSLE